MMPGFWRRDKVWRSLLILAGVGILLWSGLEDKDASGAAAFGLITAVPLTMLLLRSRSPVKINVLVNSSLAGSLIGALASVIAAALMLFKDLRHAHPFPDFPPMMILGMLERLPHWTVAGALVGIGVGLLRYLLTDRQKKQV